MESAFKTIREISSELKRLQLPKRPELILSKLAVAMYVGDNQTMTSEAAVLGTCAFELFKKQKEALQFGN